MDKNKNGLSKLMFILSVVFLVVAAAVSVFDLNWWLAGTQWILISIVFGIYATYLNLCKCGEECCKKEGQ
jgi:hypothetical protein